MSPKPAPCVQAHGGTSLCVSASEACEVLHASKVSNLHVLSKDLMAALKPAFLLL